MPTHLDVAIASDPDSHRVQVKLNGIDVTHRYAITQANAKWGWIRFYVMNEHGLPVFDVDDNGCTDFKQDFLYGDVELILHEEGSQGAIDLAAQRVVAEADADEFAATD